MSIYEKVEYLKNLLHDVCRLETKYKYDCSLKTSDISNIIIAFHDNEFILFVFATFTIL